MQWSVHISGVDDLSSEALSRFAAAESIARYAGDVRFSHCCFGTEFCEHLLPAPATVQAIANAARGRGLGFTLLTPYVTDGGIRRLRELFDVLPDNGEVVFNDWGTLGVLNREFPQLRPIQGRLLNKSLRDPRVMGIYGATSESETLTALRGSNLDCESYTAFLTRFGVAAVELDNLPQGADLSFAARGMEVAVYLPYGFISTSRVCMAAGLHYRKPDKFQPGAVCRHECQTHLLEYTYTSSPFNNRDQKFYLKGNTYFYMHSPEMLERLFEQVRSGLVSRLVLQPRLPMVWS